MGLSIKGYLNSLMMKKFKVGLALGGGAARGLSHIGILEIFEENNIPIDIITGTSIGAIIGAMYATETDINTLKERVDSYLASDVFKSARFEFLKEKDKEEGEGIFYKFSAFVRKSIFYTLSITRKSFISEETFDGNMAYLINDINIEETRIPFAATSVNLHDGEEFIFKKGELRKAVAASCALPGIIPPVLLDNKFLIDGGWIDAVPIEPALQLGADVVIGVDVCGNLNEGDELRSGLDIVFRSDTVTRHALAKEKIKKADYIIEPDVRDVNWADFTRIDEVIEKGREQAGLHVNNIKKLIRRKKLKYFFRCIGSWPRIFRKTRS